MTPICDSAHISNVSRGILYCDEIFCDGCFDDMILCTCDDDQDNGDRASTKGRIILKISGGIRKHTQCKVSTMRVVTMEEYRTLKKSVDHSLALTNNDDDDDDARRVFSVSNDVYAARDAVFDTVFDEDDESASMDTDSVFSESMLSSPLSSPLCPTSNEDYMFYVNTHIDTTFEHRPIADTRLSKCTSSGPYGTYICGGCMHCIARDMTDNSYNNWTT